MSRVDSALLGFLGVLMTHEVAYLASTGVGYETSIAHGHLKTAWLVGSVALLALLARAVITSLRRRQHTSGNVLYLAGSIAGGYALMEQIERVLDGYGTFDLLTEPVFWFGLAAAPLVAIALSWSLRSVEEVISGVVRGRPHLPPRTVDFACSLSITSLSPVCPAVRSSAVSRRGPPKS